MSTARNQRKPPINGGFLPLIERYWFVVLGIVLAIPYLVRYYKNQATTEVVNDMVQEEKIIVAENKNPITQQAGLNKITTRLDLQAIARNVAFNLGTNIRTKEVTWTDSAWWNPKGLTENDERAYNQLAKINHESSKILVTKCYYFLTRRNMVDDVKELLDPTLRSKLKLFK